MLHLNHTETELQDRNQSVTVDDIVMVFNRLFAEAYRTNLVGGHQEPFYRAPTSSCRGAICFREDFASSALHEVAHWCIAGPRRRRLDDFGYWYEPERDAGMQAQFEQAEAAPQALEWIFSIAAGIPFRVSADNFAHGNRQQLGVAVQQAVLSRLAQPLPGRAEQFADALATRGCATYYCASHYQVPPE